MVSHLQKFVTILGASGGKVRAIAAFALSYLLPCSAALMLLGLPESYFALEGTISRTLTLTVVWMFWVLLLAWFTSGSNVRGFRRHLRAASQLLLLALVMLLLVALRSRTTQEEFALVNIAMGAVAATFWQRGERPVVAIALSILWGMIVSLLAVRLQSLEWSWQGAVWSFGIAAMSSALIAAAMRFYRTAGVLLAVAPTAVLCLYYAQELPAQYIIVAIGYLAAAPAWRTLHSGELERLPALVFRAVLVNCFALLVALGIYSKLHKV